MTKKEKEKLINKLLNDKCLRKKVVRESFEFFFPVYLSNYMEYEYAPFHKEIFKILENNKIKLAVILAFRGSGKSTIITTAYVLWSILGMQQKKFIVICAQTEQKARSYLANIKKQLLENEILKKDLGPFKEEKSSIGNATALILERFDAKIMVSSVEQSIRGMTHGKYRPDLIILDDLEDQDSVKTREGRNKTYSWLTGEVIPAGGKNTRIIAVGNLLHEDCLLRRLKKNIESEEMKDIKTIYREYPIIGNDGKPSWPGKYPTIEDVKREKAITMDLVSWYREYELKIISTEEQIVRPEWIKFYKTLPDDEDYRSVAIGVDLAVSEKKSADYTAIVTAYIYGHGNEMKIYVQPNPINKRMHFTEQTETIKRVVAVEKNQHHRVKLYIEDVGYQKALIQLLEESKYDVESFSPNTDKTTRLQLITPLFRNSRIFFPEKGCEELIEQVLGFGKEKHDDLVDALSSMVIKVVEKNPHSGGSAGIGRGDQI